MFAPDACRKRYRHRYSVLPLENRDAWYSIKRGWMPWRNTVRDMSMEASLHFGKERLSVHAAKAYSAALYSSFILIAAVVFGTLSIRPF